METEVALRDSRPIVPTAVHRARGETILITLAAAEAKTDCLRKRNRRATKGNHNIFLAMMT